MSQLNNIVAHKNASRKIQRGIIIRSITRRTANSPSYLSDPNDSRNNRGSRYQETFFPLLPFPPSPSSSKRKSKASLRPTRVTKYFLSGHAQRPLSPGIAYSAATYMHLQFFPLAIGHGRGGWKNPGAWRDWTIRTAKRARARAVIRSANDICRNVPRGANFIPRATWPVIADITFPAYFSL